MLFRTVFLFEVYLAVCAPKPCSHHWVLARIGTCTSVGVAIFMKSSCAIEYPEVCLMDLPEFLRFYLKVNGRKEVITHRSSSRPMGVIAFSVNFWNNLSSTRYPL